MERRTFLGATACLAVLPTAARAAKPGQEAEIRQRIIDWYREFSGSDRTTYRTFMTDDYLLLEKGELLDIDGDLAMFDSRPADRQRSDAFDFRRIRIDGDQAYAVYFLQSQIHDSKQGAQSPKWLESAVLRRVKGEWRVALLHSSRIIERPPATA